MANFNRSTRKERSLAFVAVLLLVVVALTRFAAPQQKRTAEAPRDSASATLEGRAPSTKEADRGNGNDKTPAQVERKGFFSIDDLAACHWRRTWYEGFGELNNCPRIDHVVEGWGVRGVGRRVEVRRESKLTSVTVENSRWLFVWNVRENSVAAFPSCLARASADTEAPVLFSRRSLIPWAGQMRASYVSENDVRDGKKTEKVTLRFLADPRENDDWPIHVFSPQLHQKLLESPHARFRTRTYWFDPKTNLQVGYKCGCKSPKDEFWIEYPPPESVSRDLFRFQVPRNATLEINDPELGRQVYSEGQEGPDVRQ